MQLLLNVKSLKKDSRICRQRREGLDKKKAKKQRSEEHDPEHEIC